MDPIWSPENHTDSGPLAARAALLYISLLPGIIVGLQYTAGVSRVRFKALMGLSLPAKHTRVRAGALGRTYFVANLATVRGDPPYQKEFQHVVRRDDGVFFKVKVKTALILLAGPEAGEAEFLSATRAAKKGANKALGLNADPACGSALAVTAAPVLDLSLNSPSIPVSREATSEPGGFDDDDVAADDFGSAAGSLSSAASEQLAAAEKRATDSEEALSVAQRRMEELEQEVARLQLSTVKNKAAERRQPLAACPPQPEPPPRVEVRYLRPRP